MYPNKAFLQSDGGMPHQNRALKKKKKARVYIKRSL